MGRRNLLKVLWRLDFILSVMGSHWRQENNINFMIQTDHSALVHRMAGRGMEAGEAGEQELPREQF